MQYIFARGVKGQVEVELKANTDDFCTSHLIAYLLFASLVDLQQQKTSEGLRQDEKIFLAHIREAIFDLAVK